MKLGDMGISIKMDKRLDDNENMYMVKGLTPGYVTAEIADAHENSYPTCRNVLNGNDKHALLVTFKSTIKECELVISEERQKAQHNKEFLFMSILKDLE